MSFGLGFLFDPLKNLGKGTSLFGPPNLPTGAGGAPSLLKAGPEVAGNGPGVGLMKAGMEGPLPPTGPGPGMTRDIGPIGGPTPAQNAANSLYPSETATPPTGVTPGAISGGPGLHPDTPPADATIRAPYDTGGGGAIAAPPPGVVAPAASGPATTGSTGAAGGGAAGGPAQTKQLGQQSALSKLADMGKALGSAGGGAASGASGHAPGGIGGDPAAASRSGSSQLLQSIMEAHKTTPPGGPPGLPNVFAQRFRR